MTDRVEPTPPGSPSKASQVSTSATTPCRTPNCGHPTSLGMTNARPVSPVGDPNIQMATRSPQQPDTQSGHSMPARSRGRGQRQLRKRSESVSPSQDHGQVSPTVNTSGHPENCANQTDNSHGDENRNHVVDALVCTVSYNLSTSHSKVSHPSPVCQTRRICHYLEASRRGYTGVRR
jgi:hypothetical protein